MEHLLATELKVLTKVVVDLYPQGCQLSIQYRFDHIATATTASTGFGIDFKVRQVGSASLNLGN